MIAVLTRYHGFNGNRGARIRATTYANGRRQSLSLPHEGGLGGVDEHRPASLAQCRGYVFLATRQALP